MSMNNNANDVERSLETIQTSPPRILVLSRNRGGIKRLFALACVLGALKRENLACERTLVAWVVMGGHHRSDADDRSHFLVRGFGDNGHAYASIHAYSPNESALFDNGGRFREGGDTIDLEIECRPLANV